MPAVATAHTDTIINASLLRDLDQMANLHARRALQGLPFTFDSLTLPPHLISDADVQLAFFAAELGHREGRDLREARK